VVPYACHRKIRFRRFVSEKTGIMRPVGLSLKSLRHRPNDIEFSGVRRSQVPFSIPLKVCHVSRTVSEIFSVEERGDFETGGRGRSRSLKMAPLYRSYMTFYWSWSAIVNIALGYVVPFSSYLTLNNRHLEIWVRRH